LHFSKEESDLIESSDSKVLTEVIHKLTKQLLDKTNIRYRVNEAKRLIDMRKHPEHESWMELR